MLAMYKILIVDSYNDDEDSRRLKRHTYQLLYMDNGAISSDSVLELTQGYENLNPIFNEYMFEVQQLQTNSLNLQSRIDTDLSVDEITPPTVKLLSTMWDRVSDELYTRPISLNIAANTKRLILQSIASQYDVHNFNGPLLNRGRLFLHKLQCDRDLSWDQKLSTDAIKTWKNIARKFKRFIGRRSDAIRLIACTDASRDIYGNVVYIQNVESGEKTFVFAKNRLVN